MPHIKSRLLLSPERSAVLVVDIQEKLLPLIPSGENVVRQTERLLSAASVVGVPTAATVQYPQGLGPLVRPLDVQFPDAEEKVDFSAAVCRRELDRWVAEGRDQIIVVGIESHVCIQHTVLDLIAEGLSPYVVAEAVAARHGRDHETAITRMQTAGATITSLECVLFEWLGTSKHPAFKTISQMIKNG